MKPGFFEPGRKSPCYFSPNQTCLRYEPDDSTPFFDVMGLSVQVIPTPRSDDASRAAAELIGSDARKIWGTDASFAVEIDDGGAYTDDLPCDACDGARVHQLVVIDWDESQRRTREWVELAVEARNRVDEMRHQFKQLREEAPEPRPDFSIPVKDVLVLNRYPDPKELPPDVKRIDYGDPWGNRDFDYLRSEQCRLPARYELPESDETIRVPGTMSDG